MAEKILTVKTRAVANGLNTLTETNADLKVEVNFDNELVNVGSDLVELEDSNTSEVELLEERRLKNSVEGIEGELLINQEIDVLYEVDVDGSLYLTDKLQSVDNTFIDNNAHLIYNKT